MANQVRPSPRSGLRPRQLAGPTAGPTAATETFLTGTLSCPGKWLWGQAIG